MLDLQSLLFFKTVAEQGSFSAAAHKMNYAQSNISTRIIQLENELETTLFYRNNRGVSLTAKGKQFLQYTEELLNLLHTAETAMHDNGEAKGALSIGTLETIAQAQLPKLLSVYHRDNSRVMLSIKTGNSAELTELVLSRKLDAAFISGPVEHPELQHKTFRQEKLMLATAAGNKCQLEALQNETFLVFQQGCYYRHLLENLLKEKKITPRQIIEYDSISAVIASLCAGLGVSLLPYSVLKEYINNGVIGTIEIDEEYSHIDTHFIYRGDYYYTTAFSRFIDILDMRED